MNENQWLNGSDGDALIQYVANRLSPRQWVLLSAAVVRQLWPLLPEGVLREAVDHAERADHPMPEADREQWLAKIDAATPAALEAARLAQREIVKSCDPDAADVGQPILSRPNQLAPAFPIESMGRALEEAAQAVQVLYSEPSGQMLGLVRNRVRQAGERRANANGLAGMALRLKQEGDDLADRAAASRNKRLEEARAAEILRRWTDDARHPSGEKRRGAERKLLAQLVREVVGNPFCPPRFEPAWRTSTVVRVAQGIFEDRAFDGMPALADALLDADCDEESILRHCRGTELHAREQVPHQRGCWVLGLILGGARAAL
jgi:hypothetical protein